MIQSYYLNFVAAFPSNQFKQQEPGSNEEIAQFAEKHNVKFDMFSKVDVNGEDAIPLYKFLKYKQPLGLPDNSSIEWNFAKFIVDKEGQVSSFLFYVFFSFLKLHLFRSWNGFPQKQILWILCILWRNIYK